MPIGALPGHLHGLCCPLAVCRNLCSTAWDEIVVRFARTSTTLIVSHLKSALFHGICPARFTSSLKLLFLPGPGLGAPLSSYLEVALYKFHRQIDSAPSRYLLRGVPDPGQAEKNSLEKVVELRNGTVWEVPWSYWQSINCYSSCTICATEYNVAWYYTPLAFRVRWPHISPHGVRIKCGKSTAPAITLPDRSAVPQGSVLGPLCTLSIQQMGLGELSPSDFPPVIYPLTLKASQNG